jgi:hypothetical protein
VWKYTHSNHIRGLTFPKKQLTSTCRNLSSQPQVQDLFDRLLRQGPGADRRLFVGYDSIANEIIVSLADVGPEARYVGLLPLLL